MKERQEVAEPLTKCDFSLEEREQELIQDVPKILDKMNNSSTEVNMLTAQTNEAERSYHQLLSEWSRIHEEMQKRHGKSMDRIQPYFDAVEQRNFASCKVQGAAGAFAAASTQESEAKRKLKTVEDSFVAAGSAAGQVIGEVQQNLVCQAFASVQESQHLRCRCERDYVAAVRQYELAQASLKRWRAQARDVERTLACLEELQERRRIVDAASQRVDNLKQHGSRAKDAYHVYLSELERISEAVHTARQNGNVLPRADADSSPEVSHPVPNLPC